jgi:hypothetical protein
MPEATTYLVDLRDVLRALVTELPQPLEIWFFGSRAQRTGSKRSDVDLLIVDPDAALSTADLMEWLLRDDEQRSPLDIFLSRDQRTADSVVNGSLLKSETTVAEMVGGVLVWSRETGLVEDPTLPWVQEFRRGITFQRTIVPTDFSSTLRQLPAELNRMGLPDTLLGTDWGTVAQRCADILAAAADATKCLLVRAPTLNRKTTRLRNEYDAQNLFFLALRPWIRDVELSPFQIRYANQEKYADLGAAGSRLVIEVKFVTDAGSAAAVIKQLAGLGEFYSQPSRVRAVVFVIVVANFESWDNAKDRCCLQQPRQHSGGANTFNPSAVMLHGSEPVK